jgi:hypothetical protein
MTELVPFISPIIAAISTLIALMFYLKIKEIKDKEQDEGLREIDKRLSDFILRDKDHEHEQTLVITQLSSTMSGLDRTMTKIEKSLDIINGNMNKLIQASDKINDFDQRLKMIEKNNVQREMQ